jgi:AcrR family transcriptional regulator
MGRPRVHDEVLAARLLDVASTIIADGGTDALTVRGVAAYAGTSPSAVYALFGSKEALVHAVGEEAFARFARYLSGAPRTADPGADLLALGLAYRASAIEQPHFYRVMFATAGAGAQEPGAIAPTEHGTFRVLRQAVATLLGESARGAAVEECALSLWGLVHGLVMLELAGLMPGDDAARSARFERALRAAGPALAQAALAV